MAKVWVDLQSILRAEGGPENEEGLAAMVKLFPPDYRNRLQNICDKLGLRRNIIIKGVVDSQKIKGKMKDACLVAIAYDRGTGQTHINYKFARTLVDKYYSSERGKGGVSQLLYHEDGHGVRYSYLLGRGKYTSRRLVEEWYANIYAFKRSKNVIRDYASAIGLLSMQHQRVYGEPASGWAEILLKLHSAERYFGPDKIKLLRKEIEKGIYY